MILNNEVKLWVFTTLQEKGFKTKNKDINQLLDTPWSFVGWVDCAPQKVYIKQTPDLIGNEAAIIEILKSKYNAKVPEVIEANKRLNCFLMTDHGNSLRNILLNSFDVSLTCKAIKQFTSLQIAVGNNTSPLLNIDVPDWGLKNIPDLFENIIADKEALNNEDLSPSEIKELHDLKPKLSNLCHSLSEYGLSETLVQPDCNDNNMLVSQEVITLIDLGEISISHPFFSIINFLYVIKKHHKLREEGRTYQKIKSAAFSNYRDFFNNKNDLESAIQISIQLHLVYWILGSHRLMKACGKEKLKAANHWSFKDKLLELLREFPN